MFLLYSLFWSVFFGCFQGLSSQVSRTSTTAAASLGCRDYLTNGHRCQDIPNICFDVYGSVACQRFCGGCSDGPAPTDPVGPTLAAGQCEDNLGYGLMCQQLPGVCNDPSGIGSTVLCAKFCDHCDDTTTTTTTTTATPSTTTTTTTEAVTDCVDHVISGQRCGFIPGVCSNLYGHLACKRHCDRCNGPDPHPTDVSPPSSSSVPPGSCVDHLGLGLYCQELPGVCHDPSGVGPRLLCPKFCHICQSTTTTAPPSTAVTQPPCEDQLTGFQACENLEKTFTALCQDLNGQKTCAKYCGICKDPTTVTTTTTTSPPAPTCEDLAEEEVCRLPGFCADVYAHGLCRKTCGFCQEACHDLINCIALLGVNGGTYSTVQELCQDQDRASVCGETCGACP